MWRFDDRRKNNKQVTQVGFHLPPPPGTVNEFHNNPTQASMGDMSIARPRSNDKDVQSARYRVYQTFQNLQDK
jgi:hypothetical protein